MTLILKDPLCQLFPILRRTGRHHETDHTDLNGWIWERSALLSLAVGLSSVLVRLANLMKPVTATKEILSSLDRWLRLQELSHRFVSWYDRAALGNDGFGPDFAKSRDDLIASSVQADDHVSIAIWFFQQFCSGCFGLRPKSCRIKSSR